MITRMVKMIFREEEIESFKALFESVKDQIRNFEGCENVELLQDIREPGVFFTISNWHTEAHLEQYRASALFSDTWNKTKAKFAGKPEAWSTKVVSNK